MTLRRTLSLHRDWEFREADARTSSFRPTQGFPTEIHLDLLHHGMIPDPFRGKNEDKVQWVGEKSWVYRTHFLGPSLASTEKAVVEFRGLDTYATVRLNGEEILKTCNMFTPEEIEVTTLLRSHRTNELEIYFESAWLKGKKLVSGDPEHIWAFSNGEPSRLAVRKAQYHYGWDWGPRLVTCGPWRPVSLTIYTSRIVDTNITSLVAEDLQTAEVKVAADVEGSANLVKFDVFQKKAKVATEIVPLVKGRAEASLLTLKPALWYPRRYGEQPLYTIVATLLDSVGHELDQLTRRTGLRRVRVVQQRLDNAPGSSFLTEINNIPIFCGGSNWIPADSFLSRLNGPNYYEWVRMVAEGNQVMLRVWGGGIYEQDVFYDTCDEYGILVWQDFMFACGNYPGNPQFLHSIRREAEANVKRLCHHPSVVIWAGNNEDYQIAESEGLNYDPAQTDPDSWLKGNFPARYIYEKLLKDVVSEHAPGSHYHFGSPFGGKTSGDPTVGDVHQWNVWHGTQERYQDWDKLSGRFVSEFGMQALPDMRTVDHFFSEGDVRDKYPESSIVSFHNKAVGHDRRLGIYLTENLRYKFEPFEYYIYCTQVMQSECVASAFQLWKRQWKGPGQKYCAGALVWQANDCWPCTSWAIVDYYLRPKLAYYTIKREMRPLTIGMKRVAIKKPEKKFTSARIKTVYRIELWVCNFELTAKTCKIFISTFNLDTKGYASHPELTWVVAASPNRSTEIMAFDIPVSEECLAQAEQTVVFATLGNVNGEPAHEYTVNWPEPLKFAHISKPNLKIKMTTPDLATGIRWLQILSDVPVKSLVFDFLDVDNRGATVFDDNGIDVAPGQWEAVKVKGLGDVGRPKVMIQYLGSENKTIYELEEVGTLYT